MKLKTAIARGLVYLANCLAPRIEQFPQQPDYEVPLDLRRIEKKYAAAAICLLENSFRKTASEPLLRAAASDLRLDPDLLVNTLREMVLSGRVSSQQHGPVLIYSLGSAA